MNEKTANSLPAWRVIVQIIKFRPGLWFGSLVFMVVIIAGFWVPGVLMREFFRLVTDDPSARFGLWMIIAFLVAGEVVGVGGIYGVVLTAMPFIINTITLLRRNMLGYILKRPGAAALPDSPGEAISRFMAQCLIHTALNDTE